MTDLENMKRMLKHQKIEFSVHRLSYYPAELEIPEQLPGWALSFDHGDHYIEFIFALSGQLREHPYIGRASGFDCKEIR